MGIPKQTARTNPPKWSQKSPWSRLKERREKTKRPMAAGVFHLPLLLNLLEILFNSTQRTPMFYDSMSRPQPETRRRRKSKKQKAKKNFMRQAPIIKLSQRRAKPWSIPLHKAKTNKCDIKKAIFVERESPDHRPPRVCCGVEDGIESRWARNKTWTEKGFFFGRAHQ